MAVQSFTFNDCQRSFKEGFWCGVIETHKPEDTTGHTRETIRQIFDVKFEKNCSHGPRSGCPCSGNKLAATCSIYFTDVVLPRIKEHLHNVKDCSLTRREDVNYGCHIKFPSGENWSVCIPLGCNTDFPTIIEILDMSNYVDKERFNNLPSFLKRLDELVQSGDQYGDQPGAQE
jgi:hypothetical protein